jgi:oligoribonuclease
MKYISIDVETTGLKAGQNQLLEMGGVLEDTMKQPLVKDLPSFRAILIEKGGEYNINTYVMRMHMKLFEEIDACDKDKLELKGFYYTEGNESSASCVVYCYPEKLEEVFSAWCARHGAFSDKGKIIAAGKNFFGFDHKFLADLLPDIRFHHRCLDPAIFFLKKADRQPPNLELCCERAGIEMSGYHTAVGDSRMVIELIRKGTSGITV